MFFVINAINGQESASNWRESGAFGHCEDRECEVYWKYIQDFHRKRFQKDIDADILVMCNEVAD